MFKIIAGSMYCFIIAAKFLFVKKTLLLFLFSIAVVFSKAQLIKLASRDNAFEDALGKIVIEFKNNFNNIQGSKLPAEVDADTYTSKICLPAAVGCKIMRYHSVEDKSASWQAAMYAGDNHDEALKRYKKTFSAVKKTKINGIEATVTGFEGQLESVDENVKFAVSSLRLKTKDNHYKNLVAEVELSSNYDGWEVHLNIYSKKADAETENLQ